MTCVIQMIKNIFIQYFQKCKRARPALDPAPTISLSMLIPFIEQHIIPSNVVIDDALKASVQTQQKRKTPPLSDDQEDTNDKDRKQKKKKSPTKSPEKSPGKQNKGDGRDVTNRWFNDANKLTWPQIRKAIGDGLFSSVPFNGSPRELCAGFHFAGLCRLGDSCDRKETHVEPESATNKKLSDIAKQLKE